MTSFEKVSPKYHKTNQTIEMHITKLTSESTNSARPIRVLSSFEIKSCKRLDVPVSQSAIEVLRLVNLYLHQPEIRLCCSGDQSGIGLFGWHLQLGKFLRGGLIDAAILLRVNAIQGHCVKRARLTPRRWIGLTRVQYVLQP